MRAETAFLRPRRTPMCADAPQDPTTDQREQAAFFFRGGSETIAEGVVFFPSFGTSTTFVCDGVLLVVDTAAAQFVGRVVEDLRTNHSQAPVQTIVYTHGHIDHTTGARAFLADAGSRGHPRPRIVAHRDLPARFDRYRLLAPQNDFINGAQFNLPPDARPFSTAPWVYPDDVYAQGLTITLTRPPPLPPRARGLPRRRLRRGPHDHSRRRDV